MQARHLDLFLFLTALRLLFRVRGSSVPAELLHKERCRSFIVAVEIVKEQQGYRIVYEQEQLSILMRFEFEFRVEALLS